MSECKHPIRSILLATYPVWTLRSDPPHKGEGWHGARRAIVDRCITGSASPRNPCTNRALGLNNSNLLAKTPSNIFPTIRTRATLAVLPPPDGSRTFRCKREGMPRIDASRRRARHPGRRQPTRFRWRAAPLRGRAKPATGPGSRPTCFRKGGQGRGDRSGPVADMFAQAAGSVPESAPKASPAACPGSGRGNPGGEP